MCNVGVLVSSQILKKIQRINLKERCALWEKFAQMKIRMASTKRQKGTERGKVLEMIFKRLRSKVTVTKVMVCPIICSLLD